MSYNESYKSETILTIMLAAILILSLFIAGCQVHKSINFTINKKSCDVKEVQKEEAPEKVDVPHIK